MFNRRKEDIPEKHCSLPLAHEVALLKGEIEALRKKDLESRETLRRHLEKIKKLEQIKPSEGVPDPTDELKELQKAHQELLQTTEELKNRVQNKDTDIAALNREIETLRKERVEREGVVTDRDELEGNFRMAQQHLAKKVREATILADLNQKLKIQLLKSDETCSMAEKKRIEAQNALEGEKLASKRHLDSLNESLKATETKSSKWEEKYLLLQKKVQELEQQNRELQSMEERFGTLQKMLKGVQQLLGEPTLPLTEMESPHPLQASLFQIPTKTARYKESLFG